MTGKIHVFTGIACLSAFCITCPKGFEVANSTVWPVVGLASAAFGSYLPDIDMGRTHMGAKHKTVSKVVSKVGGGHRGITHTLLIPVILAIIMFILPQYVLKMPIPFAGILSSLLDSILFGVLFGYVTHIFMDMFNGKGCPLLWPISRTKVSILDIPSNGLGAWVFSVIIVIIVWLYVLHSGGFI